MSKAEARNEARVGAPIEAMRAKLAEADTFLRLAYGIEDEREAVVFEAHYRLGDRVFFVKQSFSIGLIETSLKDTNAQAFMVEEFNHMANSFRRGNPIPQAVIDAKPIREGETFSAVFADGPLEGKEIFLKWGCKSIELPKVTKKGYVNLRYEMKTELGRKYGIFRLA